MSAYMCKLLAAQQPRNCQCFFNCPDASDWLWAKQESHTKHFQIVWASPSRPFSTDGNYQQWILTHQLISVRDLWCCVSRFSFYIEYVALQSKSTFMQPDIINPLRDNYCSNTVLSPCMQIRHNVDVPNKPRVPLQFLQIPSSIYMDNLWDYKTIGN